MKMELCGQDAVDYGRRAVAAEEAASRIDLDDYPGARGLSVQLWVEADEHYPNQPTWYLDVGFGFVGGTGEAVELPEKLGANIREIERWMRQGFRP